LSPQDLLNPLRGPVGGIQIGTGAAIPGLEK
jgi:hypothetical protein